MASSGGQPRCPRCSAAYSPEHRFCGACGFEFTAAPAVPQAETRPAPEPERRPPREMDRLAGAPYDLSTNAGAPAADQLAGAVPYYIPPNRIILLTVLSAGMYLFYWMYVTWRHYRDHTGQVAYPVFHALTLMVPVYQYFRLHAHMRAYQELMEARGVPSTLSPARSVAVYFGVFLLGMASIMMPSEAPLTLSQQAAYVTITVFQSTFLAWMMWRAQTNLNRLWQHDLGTRLGGMPVGVVEIVITLVGFVFGWGMLAIIVIDPTLIPTEISPESAVGP